MNSRAALQNTAAIKRCIDGVARSVDKRGPWQCEAALRMRLLREGTSPTIAAATAAAARAVGEAINKAMTKWR